MIDSSLVYQLKNPLYGLKQVPWAWYTNIGSFFLNLGFKCCQYDHSIYVLHVNFDTLIVDAFVDDLVITRNNPYLIFGLKRQLANTFEIEDLGSLHFFLGLQVLPLYDGSFLS